MADGGDDDSLDKINEGDHVVLKRGDIYKAVQIQSRKKVVFEKKWFFLDNAVGQLYSTTFDIVSGGELQPVKDVQSAACDVKEAGTDNRNIVDDGKSQKLTREDIETLKEQGLKGQEIIQQLIDNSSSFKNKTEYAQDKYIKKKKKKYENTVTILRPTSRILALMYHGREPGKICHLRFDTLALMLNLANIHAGSKVLVFETCAGLVLGSIMERMGGFGSVIQMYPGAGPVRAGVENFGFPTHFHDTLHEFPICHVNALLAGTLDTRSKEPGTGEEAPPADVDGEEQPKTEQRDTPKNTETNAGGDQPTDEERERSREAKALIKRAKQEEKRKRLAAAAALLEGRNADGLVIASLFHPCPVLLCLLKFLSPSRPFAVYSQYKEPLVECFTKLKEAGGTVNLRLTDTWLRHYQVLPNRTHPKLLMSGGSGYLLSGITVETERSGQTDSEEPAAKKQKVTES
ncbi:tRNA (adenine(58)-N(1))-methyltransferase non-catalytic subunit TRM6 isoform X2 [Syngnathoides biaculeatus]|uniref:tRNA (adenine(58)-N(1))-methyltransferase non-catalytic subunit TRM6 isoform X2 n=1 Tax=Syngnathoides biaculeatus TaxID=300417 RepID=UPI002ADE84DD|nr:tRNA (adenine(58)-N(1))-methyltransferase non-catalytic subunit TRM6 isoform X2 [Syngnathoides biaculeatus]